MSGEWTTTTVCVKPLRQGVTADLFADITTVAVTVGSWCAEGLPVTFDAVLDAATTARVRDRLLSVDAAQEAQRVAIRSELDSGCCALCEATARYVLGDPTD